MNQKCVSAHSGRPTELTHRNLQGRSLTLKRRTALFEGVDLPVTDQTVPEMTSTQLAQHVLAMKNFMPIIVCTKPSETITDQNALNFWIAKSLIKIDS